MALNVSGNGLAIGNGNTSDVYLYPMGDPATATTTATLTAAQVTSGVLVASPGTSAATYTLPTATLLNARLTNMNINQSFDLTFVNLGTSSGALTISAGTGITLVGSATVAITSSATYRFRKTSATAYSVYRVA